MKYLCNLLILFGLLLVLAVPAFAHNEMMAASKWYFGKNGIVVVMEFAPSLLGKIKGLARGHNRIESCSEQELRQATGQVIQPYLNDKLTLSINGHRYPIKVREITRKNDQLWDMTLSVDGVKFDLPENQLAIDYRPFFDETDDLHFNLAYMYAFDATKETPPESMPESALVARTTFNAGNHVWETTINVSAAARAGAEPSFWRNAGEFMLLGIRHILAGYDHIAFLLALIVVGLSVREVLKVITAFTLAHSVTLLLSALQIVTLNSRLVEVMIALSICYVAVENLFRKEVRYRWLITFGFGLVHGFGFASVLQELIKEPSNLLPSVVSFNVGVEIGQLMIFLVMIPVLYLLKRRFEMRKVTALASVAVFAMGFAWLVERVFDLKFLPI